MPFVARLFSKWDCKRLLRTDPLKALIVGGFVRGLSMRDIESLGEEAGLGKTSKSTGSGVCAELHERFEAFCRRSLYDIHLVVLFLDAIYLPVRPSDPKEGVHCDESQQTTELVSRHRRGPWISEAPSSAHRFLHERADLFLFARSQLLQCKVGRPHGAFVEVRLVAEAERRVPRFELLRGAEEADDLAGPI